MGIDSGVESGNLPSDLSSTKQIKFTNFSIVGCAGNAILLGRYAEYVQLEGLWLDGMDQGTSGGGALEAKVLISDFKMKNIGCVYGSNEHRSRNANFNPSTLIVSQGVFSHL